MDFYRNEFGYTFYTAKPPIYPAWQSLFFIYGMYAWTGIFASVVVMTLSLWVLRGDSDPMAAFDWVCRPLGKGSLPRLDRPAVYQLMFCWSLAATVIYFGFTCNLTSSLVIPFKEKVPDTFQELLDNDYIIKLPVIMMNGIVLKSALVFENYLNTINILHPVSRPTRSTYSTPDYTCFKMVFPPFRPPQL